MFETDSASRKRAIEEKSFREKVNAKWKTHFLLWQGTQAECMFCGKSVSPATFRPKRPAPGCL